jgi:hypothetical protein
MHCIAVYNANGKITGMPWIIKYVTGYELPAASWR